jgi:hypothetical protein
MMRIPYFPDNGVINGGEVVSFMGRPPFTPQADCWYSFLLEVKSKPRAYVVGRFR